MNRSTTVSIKSIEVLFLSHFLLSAQGKRCEVCQEILTFLRLLLLIDFALRTDHGCTQVKLTAPNISLLVSPIWVGALQI